MVQIKAHKQKLLLSNLAIYILFYRSHARQKDLALGNHKSFPVNGRLYTNHKSFPTRKFCRTR